MRVLQYKDLNLRRVKAAFEKVKAAIEAGDFRSADVKKLNAGPYYRAKLDYANRLLLQFARIDRAASDGGTETVCLALEVIENHAYDRSRFLRGAVVDEARIEREAPADAHAPASAGDATPLRWLGPGRTQFELLDKPIVFDEAQDEACRQPAPLVVIGSAGSGKTAVTLSRLREAEGRVLYVTLSAYLAQSARALHAALGFENPKQEVDFLSYRELLETLRVPPGREVTLPMFAAWCERHRQTLRMLGDLDAQALFEESCSSATAPGWPRPVCTTATSWPTRGARRSPSASPRSTTSSSSTRCRTSRPCSSRWCSRCCARRASSSCAATATRSCTPTSSAGRR